MFELEHSLSDSFFNPHHTVTGTLLISGGTTVYCIYNYLVLPDIKTVKTMHLNTFLNVI